MAALAYGVPPVEEGRRSDGLVVVREEGIGYGRRWMTSTAEPQSPGLGRDRFSWRTVWPWLAAV